MILRDLPILADENISPKVVLALRELGLDIATVHDFALDGKPDTEVARIAHQTGRVLLTHDRDFGELTLVRKAAILGVVLLRPGHDNPEFTIATAKMLWNQGTEVQPPFVISATRSGESVVVRVRHAPP